MRAVFDRQAQQPLDVLFGPRHSWNDSTSLGISEPAEIPRRGGALYEALRTGTDRRAVMHNVRNLRALLRPAERRSARDELRTQAGDTTPRVVSGHGIGRRRMAPLRCVRFR